MSNVSIWVWERECYCAICGGPFEELTFTTAAELRRAQHAILSSGGYTENPHEGYLPSIISETEATWTREIHVLGYVGSLDGAFVSGRGRYTADRLSIRLEPNDDANHHVPVGVRYNCYNHRNDSAAVFPFHRPCYELFARLVSRNADDPTSCVDKQELFMTMYALTNTTDALILRTGAQMRQNKR
ncbi:hypothetical protein F4677DRAFT_448129 [Hypoxylon crocopeplum]|nr:hypothetical protein F4677DRAFT_448129 [Hypoxylon crocopeplum]